MFVTRYSGKLYKCYHNAVTAAHRKPCTWLGTKQDFGTVKSSEYNYNSVYVASCSTPSVH